MSYNIKSNKHKIPLSIILSFSILSLLLSSIPKYASAMIDPITELRQLTDITYMQDMNAQICINSKENDTAILEDSRDGKKYYVTKLRDGNCWMTQNLAYNGGGTQQCTVSGTTCFGWPNSGTPSIYAVGSHTDGDHSSKGNYYSFGAANTGGSTDGDTASVCPAKWQLPVSNASTTTDKSFNKLVDVYSIGSTGSKLTESPLYFQYGGYLNSGQLYDSGSDGRYWSSTPNGSDQGYSLGFNSSYVNPSNDGYRYVGYSVRCVNADVYPEEPEPPIDSDSQANVSITVSPVISIDVTQHVDTDVDFTRVAKSNIIARVGSNQPYQVLFSTNQSTLEQSPSVNNQNIPMITQDQTITAGTNEWGIKKLSSKADTTTNENTIYSPVGIGENKILFYTSNTATSETLTFPVAIAVSPQLPQGTYSTQVTLTAVAM